MTDPTPPEPDLTHAEIMAQLKADIRAARDAADAAARAAEERIALVLERLEAGGARFSRLERLAEEGARERRELKEAFDAALRRIVAIETARAIASGVDEKLARRVSAWRKWAGRGLLLVLGNGSGMALLIWWLERQPPPHP